MSRTRCCSLKLTTNRNRSNFSDDFVRRKDLSNEPTFAAITLPCRYTVRLRLTRSSRQMRHTKNQKLRDRFYRIRPLDLLIAYVLVSAVAVNVTPVAAATVMPKARLERFLKQHCVR